ncbi:MAG: hypothetical protein EP307_12150 [Rhodobacteraceae bacterium]|nr:MAG: hypothetical protein EP307_12150 [Paracoccaceae bacterium]
MRSLALTLALMSLPPMAQAQVTSQAVCDTTAVIVSKAQALRMQGKTGPEAVEMLSAEYSDRSEAFRGSAIPMLVNDFVYLQPEAAMKEDLAAFWKQTCLSTDLSAVLPAD